MVQNMKTTRQLLNTLPNNLINKIFFFAACHPISTVFNQYCIDLHVKNKNKIEPHLEYNQKKETPHFIHSIRTYYRDPTYIHFHNALRREQLRNRGARARRKHKYFNTENLIINCT